jgi:outer membrane protein assembly factor BamE (lipoprotein component of BamABCDE complex)
MIPRSVLALLACALLLTASPGCGLIYKQSIQQGNAIEQDDLDELYLGMNQRQVLFVLGTPSVRDPFNPDRWDYVQTFSRRGSEPVKRTVSLRFEDGLLSEIIGRDDPFAATAGGRGDPDEVASFVKKPAKPTQSPQDAAVGSVEEEALKGADPDIQAVDERSATESEYRRDMDVLDQTPDNDLSKPDIDG